MTTDKKMRSTVSEGLSIRGEYSYELILGDDKARARTDLPLLVQCDEHLRRHSPVANNPFNTAFFFFQSGVVEVDMKS